MKKLLLPFFAIAFAYNSFGQCSVTLDVSDSTLCQGDTATLTAVTPSSSNNITTTFAAGNNHRGNMFDIVAINDITIDSVYAHPQANTTIEIYYKVGSFSGSENTAGAWTLVGSAAVTAQAQGIPTPVPVNINVAIPAGQTYGFYVTSSNTAVSLNYTDGATQGAVYSSDANMQVLEGVGLEYPFSGTPFSPRMWNGTIYYSTNTGTATYSWSTGETTPSINVTPSTNTTYSVDVTITGCTSTITESADIEVSDVSADLGSDTTICVYNSITFDPGNDPTDTYSWSTGATTSTLSVDSTMQNSGTVDYIVNITDDFGCMAVDTVSLTVDDCLSIFETKQNYYDVYPNPAQDKIYFSTNNLEVQKVVIFDLTGSMILESQINGSTLVKLDSFNNGMYYYKLYNQQNEQIHSGKFIVKK